MISSTLVFAAALAVPEADVRLYRDERAMVLVTAETVDSARSRAAQASEAATRSIG